MAQQSFPKFSYKFKTLQGIFTHKMFLLAPNFFEVYFYPLGTGSLPPLPYTQVCIVGMKDERLKNRILFLN
jgi:hypothetical protein